MELSKQSEFLLKEKMFSIQDKVEVITLFARAGFMYSFISSKVRSLEIITFK